MKRWLQLALAALIGLGAGVGGTILFANGGNRMAIVDLDRILKESKLAKTLESQLTDEAKRLQAQLNKIQNSQEKTAKGNQYMQQINALKQQYANKVLEKADSVMAKVARRRGAQAVLVKGAAVRYARLDITDDVLKEMDR